MATDLSQGVLPFGKPRNDALEWAIQQVRQQIAEELGYRSMLYEKFVVFHRTNPDVLTLLVRFSEDVRRRGRWHYSINALFERVRWHIDIDTSEPSTGLKMNNNYRAYYARVLLTLYPQWGQLFALRALGRNDQIV